MWNLQEEAIETDDIEALCKWLKHMPKLTQSQQVKMFEDEFAKWQGCEYAVFVNSGSSANLLLIDAVMRQYNLKRGDRVIVPAVTWATNVSPIIQLGLVPVFCDVNLYNYSFDTAMLKTLYQKYKPKAIFVTHVLGFPAEVDYIQQELGDVIILEDCCESLGASINGINVGNFGAGSTFSFYWGHHITSVEGGMVCTNDEELYKLLVQKRAHGMLRDLPIEYHEWKLEFGRHYHEAFGDFFFAELGYNFRNTEINAFLGRRQLAKVNSIINIRNENYKRFCELVAKYDMLQPPPEKEGMSSFALPFVLPGRQRQTTDIILHRQCIETRPFIGGNLLRHKAFEGYGNPSMFPNAEILTNSGSYIGNNQFITTMQFEDLKKGLDEMFFGYQSESEMGWDDNVR